MKRSSTGLKLKTEKMSEGLNPSRILGRTPREKAFYFYTGIGQSLDSSSDSLTDFCDKIRTVDINSIEFHMARADFEAWVRHLGDTRLEKRLRLIREIGLTGEALREKLYVTIRLRCDELGRQLFVQSAAYDAKG